MAQKVGKGIYYIPLDFGQNWTILAEIQDSRLDLLSS